MHCCTLQTLSNLVNGTHTLHPGHPPLVLAVSAAYKSLLLVIVEKVGQMVYSFFHTKVLEFKLQVGQYVVYLVKALSTVALIDSAK